METNLDALDAAALGLGSLVEMASHVLLPLLVEVVVVNNVLVHRHGRIWRTRMRMRMRTRLCDEK